MPWYWNFLVMINRSDNHLRQDQPQQVRNHNSSGYTLCQTVLQIPLPASLSISQIDVAPS
jgi:hypothetical protein